MEKQFTEIQNKADYYLNNGYNCCESVILAVCEHLGIDKEIPKKIATPFGGGMTSNGYTCGALSAAYIAAGMTRGRINKDESRDPSYIPADVIFNKFKEKYNTIACRDITKLDLKNPDVMEQNKEKMHKEICGPIVKQVTQWILEELEK